MTTDILDLTRFYQSSLGRQVLKALGARLSSFWPSVRGDSILSLGYSCTLLDVFEGQARFLDSFSPDFSEGAWRSHFREHYKESSKDRIVVIHALEMQGDGTILLQEVWRVLKKGGKAVFIVPNRRGLWAHNDHTPFGNGQPYSRRQLLRALTKSGFTPTISAKALHFPPVNGLGPLAEVMEYAGSKVFPCFGGVLFIEVEKQSLAPISEPVRVRTNGFFHLPSHAVTSCRQG